MAPGYSSGAPEAVTCVVWRGKPKEKEDAVATKTCGMKMSGKMKSPMISPKIATSRKLGGK